MSAKIPRSNDNDYSPAIIAERQHFIQEKTGKSEWVNAQEKLGRNR